MTDQPTPTDALVERLRKFEGSNALGNGDFSICPEAADKLEALAAEVERLEWEVGKYAGDTKRLLEMYLAKTERAEAREASLVADNQRLRETLEGVKSDLMNENGLNSQSIACTIWHGPIETTVDFIDAALLPSDTGGKR